MLLFNFPRQPRSLVVNSSAFPCLWKMVLFVNLIATNVLLKLAFLPQVISCIRDISDCHSAFLEKRLAGESCSSHCYCFKPFVEHYYQLVFMKSVRCIYYRFTHYIPAIE